MMGCSRTKQCTTAAPTQSYCTPVCTVSLICKQPSCSAPDRIPASNPQQQMFLHYVSMLSQHSYSISLCSLFQYFDYSFQFLETQMLSGANSDIRWRPLHCVGSRPSPTRSSYPVPPLPHSPHPHIKQRGRKHHFLPVPVCHCIVRQKMFGSSDGIG